MHKILIEVKKNTLSFSLYSYRGKVENLNDTNIVDTEKMVFSDNYINDNIDLIRSFFSLIVIKKNIDKVNVNINAIFPLVFRVICDIPNIKTINLLEDKNISYIIFEKLLESKYIENLNCYSMSEFMLNKLYIDKNMNIKSRCEVLFLSNFMELNNFHTYSDIYYQKVISIDCNMKKIDREDIETFFRFNNTLKVVNLFNINELSIKFILELIKINNKKNIKLILEQEKNDKDIISLLDKIVNSNKKIIKNNNIKLKVKYTKEYREKNTLKQINLSFFRLILILFIILSSLAIIIFNIKYKDDTNNINDEMNEIDEVIDLNQIDKYIKEDEIIEEEEDVIQEDKNNNTTISNKPISPYYRNF